MPTMEDVIGNDLEPMEEKRQWPAFKPHWDRNKEFYHFKDREEWPFRNHRRKFPWRKTDSQRFDRNGYDDFDVSNEQAARKALNTGHDPRSHDYGPYHDFTLPKNKGKNKKGDISEVNDSINWIDNIIKINGHDDKQLNKDPIKNEQADGDTSKDEQKLKDLLKEATTSSQDSKQE